MRKHNAPKLPGNHCAHVTAWFSAEAKRLAMYEYYKSLKAWEKSVDYLNSSLHGRNLLPDYE